MKTYEMRVEGMIYPLARFIAVSIQDAVLKGQALASEHHVVSWDVVEVETA